MSAPQSVTEMHAAYVRAHEAAQLAARQLVGRRVEWRPFGGESSTGKRFVGTVSRVDLAGVLVKWDDTSFWDGTKPHGLHPADLVFLSPRRTS